MEFVSYFLLIRLKKIKRRIGYFYPSITLKKCLRQKKIEEMLALKYYIPTNKFYTIFTFFHIRLKKKIVKWKMFTCTLPFKVDIIKKVGVNCANFF